MNRKAVGWLLGELPTLVSEGVLPAEVAERLRGRYDEYGPRNSTSVALAVFGLLGSLLIGLGVILLLAHNWAQLGRPARAVLSFVPLLLGQAAAGFAVWRRPASSAWREGTGLFLTLAIGASIALVAQTYHLPGDFGAFMLTWTLLAIPAVYALRSVAVASLAFVGLMVWACDAQFEGGHALWFWPLAALLAPFVWSEMRGRPYAPRAVWLAWTVAITLCIAVGVTLERVLPGLWIVIYGSLLALFYLAGSFWFDDAPALWQRPWHTLGSAGVIVLSLMLTYDWPWESIGWNHYRHGYAYREVAAVWDYLLTIALPAGAIALLVTSVRRGHTRRLFYGAMPVLCVVGYASAAGAGGWMLSILLFNVYVFVLGMATLVQGFRARRLGTVNAGLLTLMALIVLRFFDSDWSILGRGLVFIVLGVVFLVVNLVMARRKGGRS